MGNCYFLLGDDLDMNDNQQKTVGQAICYYEISVHLLDFWMAQIDLEASKRIESLDEAKIEKTFLLISECLKGLGNCYHITHDFEQGAHYFDRAVHYAKRMNMGEFRTKCLYRIFIIQSKNLDYLSRFTEAKEVCVECYNMLAMTFNPVHYMVLKAASCLISVLIQLKEMQSIMLGFVTIVYLKKVMALIALNWLNLWNLLHKRPCSWSKTIN